MERGSRHAIGEQHGSALQGRGAGPSSGPGKRTLAAAAAPGREAGLRLRRFEGAPAARPDGAASGAFPPVPGEGMGSGDPTLDPDRDGERDPFDPAAQTETDASQRNPRVDGRPIDPASTDGWGSQYGDCHGVPAFRNIVPDAAERARIAALHDGAQPGPDQYSLTVPFAGALAYQCVEFVTRYYRDALGHSGIGSGHAQTFLQGTRGGLEVHRFPTPTRPQAGDLVVQEGGVSPVGHVGIVESVSGGGGSLTVNVVQQNWSTTTPRSSFTLTSRRESQAGESGVPRVVEVWEGGGDWAGFRRKAGTTPVAERGGTSQSRWLGGTPDHGEGNYVVQPGETAYLDTVSRIYGVSVEDLRRYNPGIGDAVTAPAGGPPVEIRVTESLVATVPTIGRAAVITGGNVRAGAGTSFAGLGRVRAGDVVQVREVVAGGEVAGYPTRDWYKIVFFTGADAYVFAGLCEALQGTERTGGQ